MSGAWLEEGCRSLIKSTVRRTNVRKNIRSAVYFRWCWGLLGESRAGFASQAGLRWEAEGDADGVASG